MNREMVRRGVVWPLILGASWCWASYKDWSHMLAGRESSSDGGFGRNNQEFGYRSGENYRSSGSGGLTGWGNR